MRCPSSAHGGSRTGRRTCAPSSSANWLVTMCFVNWSAATAASAIAVEANPLRRAGARASARRTRPARARRSTNRRERRADGRGSLTRAPPSARRRCREMPRIGVEPLRRDVLAAGGACAVLALFDPLQRVVDLRQHLLRVLLERVVDLAAERCGRLSARWLSLPPEISSTSSSSDPGWLSRRLAIARSTRSRSSSSSCGNVPCRCS